MKTLKKYRKEDSKNISEVPVIRAIMTQNQEIVESIKTLLEGKTVFQKRVLLIKVFDDCEKELN